MFKLFVFGALIVLVLIARKAKPASNDAGTGLLGSGARYTQSKHLNVATYNIQTGKSEQGKRDLLASAKVMANAELVGVQEVYGVGFDGLFSAGQAQRLAEHGNFSWLFSATRMRWFREHRGNAILSKLDVKNWRIEMLPDSSGKSFRNMTIAEVDWQGQTFHFINTHLHTRGGREDQLEVVLREFAKYPRAILVGDFNSRAKTAGLSNALKDIEITDAIAAANLDLGNEDRIDWILTKGFEVHSGTMLEKGVSDHPYYQVKLSYSEH